MEEKDIFENQDGVEVDNKTDIADQAVEPIPDSEEEVAVHAPLSEEEGAPVEVSADEIAKELSDEVSEEEKAKIEEAQKKADEQHYDVFGDRKIKKPSRFVARIVIVVAVILVLATVFIKMPLFYNCMTPGSTDLVENLLDYTGTKEFKDAQKGEEVWGVWYTYNENRQENEAAKMPDGNYAPMDVIFADADRDVDGEFVQTNLLVGKRFDAKLDELRFITVIMYQFADGAEESARHLQEQAELYGGAFESKNVLFYQLGMAKAEVKDGDTVKFVYDAWYNGGTCVEIFASDAELAAGVRSTINFNS